MEERRPERHAELDVLVNRREQAPEDQLDVHRSASKDPQERPCDPTENGVGRQSHDGQDDPEHDADHHGVHGELQRVPHPEQDAVVEEVLRIGGPAVRLVGGRTVDEEPGQDRDDARSHPPAGVPQGHRVDGWWSDVIHQRHPVGLAGRPVDDRLLDHPGLDTPVVGDGLVVAGGDEVLKGLQHRLSEG